MPKPRRGDPELLLVSFCDIVTITICAMFMALIIVIDEAAKIPVVSPVPLLKPTTNAPVYFECRNNMVFPIDREALQKIFLAKADEFKRSGEGASLIERLTKLDAGNEYFKIDYSTALMGIMGLQPRPGAKGIALDQMVDTVDNVDKGDNPFLPMVHNLNPQSQYCVFFVRDTGFNVFRKCRDIVVKAGYRHGWELVAKDEPITFEGMMQSPGHQ